MRSISTKSEQDWEIREMIRGLEYGENLDLHQKRVLNEFTYLLGSIDLEQTDLKGIRDWISSSWADLSPLFPIELRAYCHDGLLGFISEQPVRVKSAAAICAMFQFGTVSEEEKDRFLLHFLQRFLQAPGKPSSLSKSNTRSTSPNPVEIPPEPGHPGPACLPEKAAEASTRTPSQCHEDVGEQAEAQVPFKVGVKKVLGDDEPEKPAIPP
uniref:Uncharacterized protein n=1 Tax=Chromera velia CCMP2878 TaxID=1169474 RepID=A0A0G4HFD8_9ALVE|eukprot:Cvel_26925.t1-p1 / transcript=Cvel_26925.t1 / gene=Cvel_26925 / organism=Chromera_velia_CCMP2878 / gene_product=hypothetical protein / transcript_product=hypothetical protein / location=Cvel_scaffold3277:4820-6050(-) / protein_length=210 / sequence_SO=supercontig / SO=protein_coding / is_pseudo=false